MISKENKIRGNTRILVVDYVFYASKMSDWLRNTGYSSIRKFESAEQTASEGNLEDYDVAIIHFSRDWFSNSGRNANQPKSLSQYLREISSRIFIIGTTIQGGTRDYAGDFFVNKDYDAKVEVGIGSQFGTTTIPKLDELILEHMQGGVLAR